MDTIEMARGNPVRWFEEGRTTPKGHPIVIVGWRREREDGTFDEVVSVKDPAMPEGVQRARLFRDWRNGFGDEPR